MKQTWKKLTGVFLALICMLALTACGGSAEEEEPLLDAAQESQLISSTVSVVEKIVSLSDEEIENFLKSTNDFEVQAMEAWVQTKDEVGAYQGSQEATVEYDKKETSVMIPVQFSNYNADITIVYDKDFAATSITIDVKYPMSVNLERAALNTVMGLGIVFFMLLFLSFIISLFRFIPTLTAKKKAPAVQEPAPAAEPSAQPEEEELADDSELVAVIAAAIAASENTSTDSFVVRSIKKVNRRNWKRA